MKETLDKIIKANSNGLFLLDPPTGFGKTTAVVEVIKEFLHNPANFPDVNKMFFITNLIGNLPVDDFHASLTPEEKSQCFHAKATSDYVIDRFMETDINNREVTNSKEYENLRDEIQSLHALRKFLEDRNDADTKGLRNSIEILQSKISTYTEPVFRQFLKTKFLFNKSIVEKKKFIKENGWIKRLYPICEIEKYKIIFLTTRKFISPIDTFVRMPFYAYSDKITKKSVIFIDEFDATKEVLLNQIVDDGLKSSVDIVSLFLDLYFALQNVVIPQKLLQTTEYNKAKVESGPWYASEDHFKYWKERFAEVFKQYHIEYLMKSVDFQYDRAFLFDDGKYFNIVKDNAKKFIYANLDKKEELLALRGCDYNSELTPINKLIRDLEYCIDGFTKAIFYVSNNYLYFKNQNKQKEETKYSLEEAVYTVLDTLNLSQEGKDYLFNKVIQGDYIFDKPQRDNEMRRGFNFAVVEDSNYHDMKSVVHSYSFPTTPEDVIIKLAEQSLVIGISATAKVDTCIGNYDIKYLSKKMGDKIKEIGQDDFVRIKDSFDNMINAQRGKYAIHTHVIDDFNAFSDREKCGELIEILFSGDVKEKYLTFLNKDCTNGYYFLIELKLAWIYKEICEKGMQSFIAFANSFPKIKADFDINLLHSLFDDVCAQNNYTPLKFYIVKAENFEMNFRDIRRDLAQGEQVFVLTTYKTIGTGKNIQYIIPRNSEDRVVKSVDDTRGTKDFEGIYLVAPTNLTQRLSYDSEDKYGNLAKYLFHQEYLYQNKHLTYSQMKFNIVNGFRMTFFKETNAYYPKNGDINLHTLKLIIQAVGRICRCRNKNKNVYIYTDKEVVERIKSVKTAELPKLLNEEFKALLNITINRKAGLNQLVDYSKQSKQAYTKIRKAAYTVRQSPEAVDAWKDIREFVLKNPTTNNPGKYKEYYFEFDEKYSGFSYKQNNYYDIVDIRMDTRYDMQQVSEQACDLPEILSIKTIEDLFIEKGYARRFGKAQYIMTPSLFKQIYLGALGEVVGRHILDSELGWDLEELDDVSFYEFFDYKLGNLYFDFKHWDTFRKNNEEYVKKVEGKLAKIRGAKCFVINLLKRTEARPKINIGETVIQIPYLIDGENGVINTEAINYIGELYSN